MRQPLDDAGLDAVLEHLAVAALRRDAPPPVSTWCTDGQATYVYHLFPNAMFATFPDQVLLIVIDPVYVEHFVVTIYAMTTAESAEKPTKYANGRDPAGARTLLAAGALEDNEMSQGVQRGLRAGANTYVEFGRHESAIGRFHATLDERLRLLIEPTPRPAGDDQG
ncbi:SRPBCC family protein [Mycobacterium xenopi]|uniref:SRPBCC family protein n=1 Tax=Mycobacterium xenopi TaxID=1789 RepID=UPI002F9656ED